MPNALPDCDTLVLDRGFAHLGITFNRPASRNAMNDAMADELEAVFAAIAADASVRAVVLRGAGRHFCAGGDLKDTMRHQIKDATGMVDVVIEMVGGDAFDGAIRALMRRVMLVCSLSAPCLPSISWRSRSRRYCVT